MTAANSPSIQQLFDLSGRAALITGARGYLGRALADALAEAGARVVVSSRNIEHARTVAAALGGKEAGHHLAVCLDYLDETSVEQGFENAVAQAGQIDILVNNGHDPLGGRLVDGHRRAVSAAAGQLDRLLPVGATDCGTTR